MAAAVWVCLGEAGPAVGGEVEVRSHTFGEGYVVVVPGGDGRLLRRRRLSQYLTLGVYDLLPPRPGELERPPEAGRLRFQTTLRLRHDFGDFQRRASGRAGRILALQDDRQMDLLYGYLEGTRLLGWVDLRLGRQIDRNGLDFYAFDGGFVRVRTPVHLAVEGQAGISVDPAGILGYPTFSLDGTDVATDRAGLQVVAGGGASVLGLSWLSGRVGYRRVFQPAGLASDGRARVRQEILTGSLRLRLLGGAVVSYGSVRYELGAGVLGDVSAGTEIAVPGRRHLLRLAYLRTRPVFDLASIWNVFFTVPYTDVRVSYQVRLGAAILEAGFQHRTLETAPLEGGRGPQAPRRATSGATFSALYRTGRLALRADGFVRGGDGGLAAGGGTEARVHLWWERLALDGRTYYTYADGPGSLQGGGHLWAVQAGADVRLYRGVRLAVLAEESGSVALLSGFRLFAALTMEAGLRGGTR